MLINHSRSSNKHWLSALPRRVRGNAALAMMLLLGAPALMAQTLDTATVRGQVTDPQGAAIEDASVALVNQLTGLKREARTDSEGRYQFAGLPLTGRYTLSVSSQGFRTVERKDLGLRADEAATINVALDVSQIEIIDGVQIYGTTEGVRSDSPQTSTRLDLQKIDETPVFGRKLTNLPLLNSAVKPTRCQLYLFFNNTLFVINGVGGPWPTFNNDCITVVDAWELPGIFCNMTFSALQSFIL